MDAEKDDPRMIPRRDKHASPLGHGADPGPAGEARSTVGALHGAGVPNERGGPEGFVDRENEDSRQSARRDAR